MCMLKKIFCTLNQFKYLTNFYKGISFYHFCKIIFSRKLKFTKKKNCYKNIWNTHNHYNLTKICIKSLVVLVTTLYMICY